MKFYAHFTFLRNPLSQTSYLLRSKEGEVKGLSFLKYADTPQNRKLGSANLEYIRFEVPRNPSIRKFFSHVVVAGNNQPLTSVEAINNQMRTFGDAKKIGLTDLILIQFSDDQNQMDMYFIRDKGNTKQEKQEYFKKWCSGEKLTK